MTTLLWRTKPGPTPSGCCDSSLTLRATEREPTISAFYGILIRMYFGDHPPPHFHARHGEYKARCDIAGGAVIDGELPPRAARLVREWASLRRAELEENWRRCEQKLPLSQVDPLP